MCKVEAVCNRGGRVVYLVCTSWLRGDFHETIKLLCTHSTSGKKTLLKQHSTPNDPCPHQLRQAKNLKYLMKICHCTTLRTANRQRRFHPYRRLFGKQTKLPNDSAALTREIFPLCRAVPHRSRCLHQYLPQIGREDSFMLRTFAGGAPPATQTELQRHQAQSRRWMIALFTASLVFGYILVKFVTKSGL
ncbi:hypothetical protein L218DRAFT_721658 [Marasmius fiardii PR-910]|nr:hypothetical protein L218DRAFT_721658 [Marasmius fiardii PR-910]